jgi:hypothetical protein
MKRSKCLSLLNADIDIDKLLDIWENKNINEAAEALNYAITYGKPILTEEDITLDNLGLLDEASSESAKKEKIIDKKTRKNSFKDAVVDFIIPSDDLEDFMMTTDFDDDSIVTIGDLDDL